MGVIAETVMTWPGAKRSAHPQTSFTAIRPQAETITENHALGERSPLARLEETGAEVLFLGVGWDTCTAFHLADYRVESMTMEESSFAVMTEKGLEWKTVRDVVINDDGYSEIGKSFEKEFGVARGKIGGAGARLFRLSDAVQYAEGWLSSHRPPKSDTSDVLKADISQH